MKTYENHRLTEFPKFNEIIFNFQEYNVLPQGYMINDIEIISNKYCNMNIIYIS